MIPTVGMNHHVPSMNINYEIWLQAFRNIGGATNQRTVITSGLPQIGVGNNASLINYEHAQAIASTLVLANMNSIPLDWAARLSVGGTNMSFFIVKQLPVLPPDIFLEKSNCGPPWVQLIIPRALELTYTSYEMTAFAKDLGFEGPPFTWDEEKRHFLKSELDAIFAHMYELDRSDLKYILDPPSPNSSFPVLKSHEMKEFGEYRTKRYVLQAFDQLDRGEPPNLS